MIYIDYCILRQSYDSTYDKMRELLDKKEEAFTRTQPNAIRYDGVKVMNSHDDSSIVEDYILDAERIDRQIGEVKAVFEERFQLLVRKENELRKSKDVDDQIFVRAYIERLPVRKIAMQMHYSKETIWKRRKKIEVNLVKHGLQFFTLRQ